VGDGYAGTNCGSACNSLLFAIPKARRFLSFSEGDAHAMFVWMVLDAQATISTEITVFQLLDDVAKLSTQLQYLSSQVSVAVGSIL
jgi:hypothetical protein